MDKRFSSPRVWSNIKLREIAPLFKGDVINVSAADDLDKEGNCYKDYFVNARSYVISNYSPGSSRGYRGRDNEILLDLTQNLPKELINRYDVVYNHTTMEHIFDVFTAFRNLCMLSKDIVIIVLPFAQLEHGKERYNDYWRFTLQAVEKLFEVNNMKVVYKCANDEPNTSVYVMAVASRFPENWKDKMPKDDKPDFLAHWLGVDPIPKKKGRLEKFLRRYNLI